MKLLRMLAVAAATVVVAANTAAAAPAASSRHQEADRVKHQDFDKAMQSKKERVQSLLKEGKITKEKADAINAAIDAKIKKVKEFEGLTLEQKKAKLLDGFKARMDRKVKEGELTKAQADELLKKFTEKVNAWDGTGHPHFFKKGFKGGKTE